MLHKQFSRNTKGRDFIIGDLHGCYDLLLEKMKGVSFDKSVDRMFSVGDLIDRGPDSVKCISLINESWFHAVQGNHERMMVEAVVDGKDPSLWLVNGGHWSMDVNPNELFTVATITSDLPYSITVETRDGLIGISHAQPPSLYWEDAVDPDDRSVQIMLWARSWIEDEEMDDVGGVNYSIHGHTPVVIPKKVGNVVFIDTGAYATGVLTCLEL